MMCNDAMNGDIGSPRRRRYAKGDKRKALHLLFGEFLYFFCTYSKQYSRQDIDVLVKG